MKRSTAEEHQCHLSVGCLARSASALCMQQMGYILHKYSLLTQLITPMHLQQQRIIHQTLNVGVYAPRMHKYKCCLGFSCLSTGGWCMWARTCAQAGFIGCLCTHLRVPVRRERMCVIREYVLVQIVHTVTQQTHMFVCLAQSMHEAQLEQRYAVICSSSSRSSSANVYY